jgi:acetyl-CoA acetyltransferase
LLRASTGTKGYALRGAQCSRCGGTTSEQLGEIAAGVREFAGLNPNAMYRDPITAEDVVILG